jgi:hypothetical protein
MVSHPRRQQTSFTEHFVPEKTETIFQLLIQQSLLLLIAAINKI